LADGIINALDFAVKLQTPKAYFGFAALQANHALPWIRREFKRFDAWRFSCPHMEPLNIAAPRDPYI
jgi:hypothetical protein